MPIISLSRWSRASAAAALVSASALALAASPAAAAPAPLRATMGLLGADLINQTTLYQPAEPLGDVTGDRRADLSLLSFLVDEGGGVDVASTTVFGQTTHANVDLGGTSPRVLRLPSYVVEGAGDVNGDGIADVLISGPAPSLPQGYGSAVVFGGPGLTNVDLARLGSRGFYIANGPVRVAGDLNGDGRDELIGGAFTDDGELTKLVLIAGRRTGGIVVDLRNIGTRGIDLPDSAMADMPEVTHGDVNGDGVDDVAINQVGVPGVGRCTVLFGARNFTAISPNAPGARGLDVTGVATLGRVPGDVTGDGRDDLLVMTRDEVERIVPGPAGPGVVDATSGTIALEVVAGAQTGQVPVAGVGDLTGDGRDDLVVQSGIGASFVAGRPAPARVTRNDALPVPGSFGEGAVSAVGDVDGDGRGDALQISGAVPLQTYEGAALLTAGADVLAPLWPLAGKYAEPVIEPRAFRPGPGATTLSMRLSEPATAEVVLRTSGGVLVGKLDVPLETTIAQAGWDGRVNGRALPPGDYRSSVTPVDAAGNRGETKTVEFTILP